MQPDPAAAAIANWQDALSEQLDVECQIEVARKNGTRSELVELLVLVNRLEVRSALLLAHAVEIRLVIEGGRLDSENLTSTRMGLPDHLPKR